MMVPIIIVLYGLILPVIPTSKIDIPPFLTPCHRNDPNMIDCIMKNINDIKPHLENGLPEYNVPPIGNFYINNLSLSSLIGNGNRNVKLELMDLYTTGAAKAIVSNFKVNKFASSYTFDVLFPRFKSEGKYIINAKVLVLDLKGQGKYISTFSNVSARVSIELDHDDGDDDKLITMKKVNIKAKVPAGKLKVIDQSGMDKQLEQIINDVLNANFVDLAKELLPYFEQVLETKFFEIAESIAGNFDYKTIFPE